MPYRDLEKQREYQREWSRRKFLDKDFQEERRAAKARWRRENLSRVREYARNWKKTPIGRATTIRGRKSRDQEKRDWLAQLKINLVCRVCGEDHPAALDFHHKDPATKEYSVARMVTGPYNLEQLKAEVDKCEVLCSNCHRVLHWEEKQRST